MSIELRTSPFLDDSNFLILEGPATLEIQGKNHPVGYARVRIIESSDGKHPQEIHYLVWSEPKKPSLSPG